MDRSALCSRQLGDTGSWGLTTKGQFRQWEEDSQLLALQGSSLLSKVHLGERRGACFVRTKRDVPGVGSPGEPVV